MIHNKKISYNNTRFVLATVMDFDGNLFFCAIGLALILEGSFWALFPKGLRSAMEHIVTLNDEQLRWLGLAGMLGGILLIWIVQL